MRRKKKLVLLLMLVAVFTLLVLLPEKQAAEVQTFAGLSKPREGGGMRCFCPNKLNSCGCAYHTED